MAVCKKWLKLYSPNGRPESNAIILQLLFQASVMFLDSL